MSSGEIGPSEFPEPGREDKGGVEANPAPVREEDPARKAVLEQKQFVTGRISETVRYIGFGLLAIFYVLVSSGTPFAERIVGSAPWLVIAMAMFGVLGIMADYLQYVFGSLAVDRALNQAEPHRNMYNKTWFVYRAREACFWAKQLFIGVGSILLVVILLRSSF